MFLTHRAAVDLDLIDWLRPLSEAGVRPDRFASILLELATKQYFRRAIVREQDLRIARQLDPEKERELLSEFGDRQGYAGCVPSGKYFKDVLNAYGRTTRAHMDAEVKKRCCTDLKWDASYKEAKHLAQYHGSSIFTALVTGTNRLGEVRVQFHVVSDSHEQMVKQIAALLSTLSAYGMEHPRRLATDKPAEDKAFFQQQIPSLRDEQERLDALVATDDATMGNDQAATAHEATAGQAATAEQTDLPTYTINVAEQVQTASTVAAINQLVDLMRTQLTDLPAEHHVLSLDAEWEIIKNASGFQTGRGRLDLIQIGYRLADGVYRALLLKVTGMRTLPPRLRALFEDTSFTFTGRSVANDARHVGKDFDAAAVVRALKTVDLGVFARARNVVTRGTAGLQQLVRVVLGKHLSKAADVRCGRWSAPQLSEEQRAYGAMDVTSALEVYHHLSKRADLSARLSAEQAVPTSLADLVPRHGSVAVMATRAAALRIIEPSAQGWTSPFDDRKRLKITKTRRLVEVTAVYAPSFVVPSVKCTGRDACLGDFGAPPFQMVVPLTMLAPHVACEHAPVWSQPSPPAPTSAPSPPSSHMPSAADDVANGIDADADAALEDWEPSTDEIDLLRATAASMASSASDSGSQSSALDPPPAAIADRYSSVTGDAFHFMDRPKVPMRHEIKKAYFVALRDAWFIFNPKMLHDVKQALRAKGLSEADIEAKLYYDFDYFRERVERCVAPPSIHYWRVRRVFEIFGPLVDSKTKAPLFNDAAWKRASRVLDEILAGNAADAPGYVPYHQRLGANGQPMVDADGLAILDCSRGTSDTECAHKQIVAAYGSWIAGVELSDQLLREWRHRYNHRIAERRRLGFPKVGHYDTWLIDEYQLLVERNHGVDLFPGWSNTTDYAPTPETFGTVPLHSSDLGEAMADMPINAEAVAKLSSDRRYLCEAMGTPLPLLPIHGKSENSLFTRLALEQLSGKRNATIDFDALAIEWCRYVDGVNIFPKLPVYLRQHHAAWERNQRIKDAVQKAQLSIDELYQRFERDLPTAAHATSGASDSATGGAAATNNATSGVADDATDDETDDGVRTRTANPPMLVFPPAARHVSLPSAPAAMAEARRSVTVTVAGERIGDGRTESRYVPGRKRGKDRSRPDGQKRQRRCNVERGGCGSTDCPGRWNVAKCDANQEQGQRSRE